MHSNPGWNKKFLFVNQGRLSIYSFGFFSTLILITGNVLFVTSHPGFWPYGIVVLTTASYLALSYIVGFFGKEFDKDGHDKLVNGLDAETIKKIVNADVDVYLPICGEPQEVIENTWKYVWDLIGEHKNLKVYVLDDKPSEWAKTTAKRYGFHYITRETNELKKAGNLRNAFKQTTGEYILIFDADFCPRKDFLYETMPYMLKDSKIAIVQTPQFFDYNESKTWVQNGAAAVQELFYRLIQVNRDTFGGAICVGTNALYRREALAPFGGTAAIGYSEDVRTGFMLLRSGWKIKYIPIILAEGENPETLRQFFTMYYRWSLGSISLFFTKDFWKAKISVMQRICFLTGMGFYISTAIAVLAIPIPTILMLVFFPEKIFWYNLLFSIPSLLFGTIFMRYWNILPYSMSVLRCRQISYFAHFYALRDFLLGNLEAWLPTGSNQKSQRYESFKALYKHFSIMSFTIPMMLIIGRVIEGYNPINFLLVIFFISFNAFITWPTFKDL